MPAMRASGSLESRLRWLEPRPPSPTMATLIRSFAPQTRAAAAAVAAPMKNLREVRSDIDRPRLLYRRPLYMVAARCVAACDHAGAEVRRRPRRWRGASCLVHRALAGQSLITFLRRFPFLPDDPLRRRSA